MWILHIAAALLRHPLYYLRAERAIRRLERDVARPRVNRS